LRANLNILDNQVEQVISFIEWAMKEIENRAGIDESDEKPSDHYIG
jgi:hypothetical protein